MPIGMIETNAERFCSEAQECLKLAEKALSQVDKEAWLLLAADWIKIAENAQEQSGL